MAPTQARGDKDSGGGIPTGLWVGLGGLALAALAGGAFVIGRRSSSTTPK